jgi:hypothetical protein
MPPICTRMTSWESPPMISEFMLRLRKPRVLVLGDVFVERFTYGVRQRPGTGLCATTMKPAGIDAMAKWIKSISKDSTLNSSRFLSHRSE